MQVATPGYQQTLKSFSGPHWRRGSRLNSTISKASWSTPPRGTQAPYPERSPSLGGPGDLLPPCAAGRPTRDTTTVGGRQAEVLDGATAER